MSKTATNITIFSEKSEPSFSPKEKKLIFSCIGAFLDSKENQKNPKTPPLLGERKTISLAAFDIMREKNQLACHEVYCTIRNGIGYGGMLPEHKLGGLAKNLGKRQLMVRRHLKQLEDMGLVEKRKTIWFTVSDNELARRNGYKRNKTVDITKSYGSKKLMTAMHTSTHIGEQAKKMLGKKRNGKGDFSKSIPMSIGYNAMYLNLSERTVGKHRRLAKANGLMAYERDIIALNIGRPTLAVEYINNWNDLVQETYQCKRFFGNGFAFVAKDGRVCVENPAHFDLSMFPSVKNRGIPKPKAIGTFTLMEQK